MFERRVAGGDRNETPVFGVAFLSALSPVLAYAVSWRVLRGAGDSLRREALAAGTAAAWSGSLLLAHEVWRALERVHGSGSDATARLAVVGATAVVALAMAWAVRREGWAGSAPSWGPLALAGAGGLLAALSIPPRGFEPVRHADFAAGVVATVALAAPSLGRSAPGRASGLAAVVLLFVVGTAEIAHWSVRGDPGAGPREDLRFRAAVVLSVFWAAYGAALVGAGFWRKTALLRWAGMGLLLLTVAKVFLLDLARLDTASRIGSFLALGALLVAASYLYQRLRRARPGDPAA